MKTFGGGFSVLLLACSMLAGVACFAAPFAQLKSPSRSRNVATTMSSTDESTTESKVVEPPDTVEITAVTTFDKDASVALLDDALRYNSTAASELLNNIQTMRSNNVTQADIEAYLNNLLKIVDTTAWWSEFRVLRRFSRRARRASLARVLELSMPVSETQESVGNGEEADQQRRRRSLVVLLRALADNDDNERRSSIPAIAQLERVARREAKARVSVKDMASRLPEGLETPEYDVIASRSGYEIRNYKPFSVCSVSMNKPRPKDASKTDAKTNPQLAGASSFGALAGYLFGKNQESTAMKMTTPVLKVGPNEEDQKMSFVLPSQFWDKLNDAPKPFDESGVVLEKNEGGDRAVVMFGGFAGNKDVEERKKQLLDGLEKDKEWTVEPNALVTVAQYNDPFTPPWKRRNEVSVKVVRRQQEAK